MKHLLKIEEAAQLAAAIAWLYLLPFEFSWYVWILLFLLPDISMAGYLGGTKTGAVTYNIIHHKASGLVVLLVGLYAGAPVVCLIGLLLFAHSAFDRMLGYGLKYSDSFQHTHLGRIGNNKTNKTFIEPLATPAAD